MDLRAFIRDCTRTPATVYQASGVPGACSHRFRHTLATEVLELGGTIEEAADILGDSEAIVRKHYAKWSRGRQSRISALLGRLCRDFGHNLGTQESSGGQIKGNEVDGWMEWWTAWDSEIPWPLKTRKLLILRSARRAKTGKKAGAGHNLGTRTPKVLRDNDAETRLTDASSGIR